MALVAASTCPAQPFTGALDRLTPGPPNAKLSSRPYNAAGARGVNNIVGGKGAVLACPRPGHGPSRFVPAFSAVR